jgi:hypothetical protein
MVSGVRPVGCSIVEQYKGTKQVRPTKFILIIFVKCDVSETLIFVVSLLFWELLALAPPLRRSRMALSDDRIASFVEASRAYFGTTGIPVVRGGLPPQNGRRGR